MAKDPFRAQLHLYYDGALDPVRQEALTAHLAQCAECREELAHMKQLSALLQTYPPAPRRLSPARFTARVQQQLIAPPPPAWNHQLQLIWQGAPFAIISFWIVMQAGLLLLIGLQITIAAQLLPPEILGWLPALSPFPEIAATATWVDILAAVGGWILSWSGPVTLEIGLTLNCALLFAAWLAVEWMRQEPKESEMTPAVAHMS